MKDKKLQDAFKKIIEYDCDENECLDCILYHKGIERCLSDLCLEIISKEKENG